MMSRSTKVSASLVAFAAAVGLFATTTPAQAATATGWVGPAGNYLTTSTINNAPLTASSRIYSTVGARAAEGDLGVRARLFKSGVLCEAIDFRYNTVPTADYSVGTTLKCGSGSYNSHGFVAVWNPTNFTYDQYLTFPSNPLNYTAPAGSAAKTADAAAVSNGTNAKGQSFGSGDKQGDVPDLVAAYATNGRLGYVKKTDLASDLAKNPSIAAKTAPKSRTVAVFDKDGSTQVGTFQIG